MTATLILWGHALAALLFGAMAQAERGRAPGSDRPRGVMVAALALTALWALAVAGIDADDISTRLAQSARSIAWLYVLVVLSRREGAAGRSIVTLAAVVAVVLMVEAALALVTARALGTDTMGLAGTTRALLAAMATTGALMVLSHFGQTPGALRSGRRRMLILALALMWSADIAITAATAFAPGWEAAAIALRGATMAAAALIIAAGSADRGVAPPSVSRALMMRVLALLALILYAGATAMAANAAAAVSGNAARAVQTVVVFASTAALLAFASTPWLRAWSRVVLAKHLFGHRYDYRAEWQRFTATLGNPGEGSDPLGLRIVQALAALTDSPAGLLMIAEGPGATVAAAWRWQEALGDRSAAAPFVRHLAATGRILSLDAIRAGHDPDDAAIVPRWLVEDAEAWAVLPLIHGEELIGAIVLARPPIDRALDWEDFDLLRIVGRQSASYLAEERAHAALADARRFDEFNRRFAFLMHDIKNVASQLSLVARNAERHAENPEFRADMLATLRDSAGRMTTLLARLGQHDATRPEALQALDIGALAQRVARCRRAQHVIQVESGGDAIAQVHPVRLEQALGHIVQNAVDASGDAPVTVSIRREADMVRIDIVDWGCGMSAAFVRDQLFRPFASSKPAGFGIGAFEARQLIHGMGGTIEVDSREGEGTRFRIHLPAAPSTILEVAA